MQYWWFSVLVAAIAVGLVALVVWLHRHLRASYIVAMCVGTVLIIYKTCEFSYYRAIGHPEYPVEFSHISYFIIGATMLTGVKKMRFFAAFCGSAGGIGYLIATILSPDSMVTEMSSTYYVVMAVIQHELLFFVGLLLMFDVQRHSYRDIWVPIVGTVVIVGFSLLVYYHYIYPDFIDVEKIVIIKIIKGTIIGYVIGEENLTPAIQVVTSIGVAVLVVAVMMLFLWLNNKMFDKAERLAAERGTTLPTNDDLGIIPWVKKAVAKRKAKKSGGSQ